MFNHSYSCFTDKRYANSYRFRLAMHILSSVILCHPLSSFVILCNLLSSSVVLCHSLSSSVILCHPPSSSVILCHPLSSSVIFIYKVGILHVQSSSQGPCSKNIPLTTNAGSSVNEGLKCCSNGKYLGIRIVD